MKFHKEGYPTLILTLIVSGLLIFVANKFLADIAILQYLVYALCAFLLIVVLQFFRSPSRNWTIDEKAVIAPADGKVVVIEEVEETEYFKDRRLQVSIFMSPINVHINRYPFAGTVTYAKMHKGLYLVAWHPKSSTENERSTVVVKHTNGTEVLFRQVAGALARRIVMYSKPGDVAKQTEEFGFIKFGSRVDLYFPLGTELNVSLNEVVKGGITKIAKI